ncbi:hypothetical protein SALBM311S_02804 [Streptomyces alboniger]
MAVGGVAVGRGADEFGEPFPGRVRVGDVVGPDRQTVHGGEPGREAALGRLDGGCRVQRPRRGAGARQWGDPGHGVVPSRPVAQSVREFGEPGRVRCGFEGANGVADPDDRMGGTAVDPGQQARPPQGEDVVPGVFGEGAGEVADPVGGPARITQRRGPVVVGDGGHRGGEALQLASVEVQPAVHGARPSVRGECLDDHGCVVGEPSQPLRSRGVKAVQGFFELPARVAGVHAGTLCRARTGRIGRGTEPLGAWVLRLAPDAVAGSVVRVRRWGRRRCRTASPT